MNGRKVLRSTSVFVAALLLCASAQAQLFRAYVASSGSDANPCTLPQPCRLLPAALAAVANGGEIWMLDSANYNTGQINITKSVSIFAIPGAVGSVVATGGGDAININAASVKVTLRNLVIVHLTSSLNGIEFVQGAELNVAECEIANVQASAIYANAANSKVTVKNSVLRGAANGAGFYASGTVVASLDGVHSYSNSSGVLAYNGSRVTVSNSVLSGNTYGVYAFADSGTTRLVIERSVTTGNNAGIYAQASNPGDVADVAASHNTVTQSVGAGIAAYQGASATTTVIANDNTVTENAAGFHFVGGTPTIYSRGNNTLKFNTNDLTGGATLTALAGQ